MKVLIANNSFKDVFNPIELCSIINLALGDRYEVIPSPMCDGGEYTYDVLLHYYRAEEVLVHDIINPYGEKIISRYLVLDSTAYVISSEILRLYPEESAYKNPLYLTDYGLGQILQCVITAGYKKIYICLGGTSTVAYGLGMAQALGAIFYDKQGDIIDSPVNPSIYKNLHDIAFDKEKFRDIDVTVINDANTKACQMDYTTSMKIGDMFKDKEKEIIDQLHLSAQSVYSLTHRCEDDSFSGNAGGVYYGIETIFNAKYVKGTEFFVEKFGLVEKIMNSDIVITGEGKFDSIELDTLPLVIIRLCMQYNKPLVLVCGQINDSISVDFMRKLGISGLINCQEFYNVDIRQLSNIPYYKIVEYYKEYSPQIIMDKIDLVISDVISHFQGGGYEEK